MENVILILAANPKDAPRLRLDEEVREIDEGLRRARQRERFVLHQKWAVRPLDVRRAMLDYEPHIVHFVGHGAGIEGICLEDDSGLMRPIAVEALADFFSMFPSVKCVVLNACYTEPQAQAISKHIDYVLGMPHTINDKLAIIFAVAFYDAIAAAKSIEFAFKLSSNALHLEGVSSDSLPVIKVKQKLINSGVEANSQHLPTPPLLPNIQSYGNEPLYRRGIMRATQGNYAGAEADFAVVLEKYPAAELHFLRGVSRSLQLNYAAAESDFTIAIELGIRNADIYHRRGVMRGAQDKFAEAEEDFTAAIAYGHKDGEVYFLRSETRRQQGDYPGAEADLTAAIERGYMPQRHD